MLPGEFKGIRFPKFREIPLQLLRSQLHLLYSRIALLSALLLQCLQPGQCLTLNAYVLVEQHKDVVEPALKRLDRLLEHLCATLLADLARLGVVLDLAVLAVLPKELEDPLLPD